MKFSFIKKPGILPGFFFLLVSAVAGYSLVRKEGPRNVYGEVCYFIAERIYLDKATVDPWYRKCLQRANEVPKEASREALISDLNKTFEELKTSHLLIYNAEESQKVWQGETKETGIEADYVDGELVIFKVHKDSPAEKLGLRMGDVIMRINDELGTPKSAEADSGVFIILRQGVMKEYKVEARAIKRDESPQVIPLSEQTVVYKVPSFRAEFFEKPKWTADIQELKKYKKIIVDFRNNLGGNFVAGLRFLSPFMCSPQDIGYLWKPKSTLKVEQNLPDEVDDEKQVDILDRSFLVKLWTFENYDCLTSSLAVLVDSGTASTAEMAAQALKDYVGAKIYGSSSAGQLLVGVWYPLPELGPGVKISVPEAIYQTRRGRKIEGPGVQVDKVLYYNLKEMQNGEDSWYKSALRSF